MIDSEPSNVTMQDQGIFPRDSLGRLNVERIRDKWIIPSHPEQVCLITDFWAINEPGYGPRLGCLKKSDGPVVSVGSSDRALSLISSLRNPQGEVLVELNPYFTEVGIPYYAEAILASEGDITKLHKFFADNNELLLGLFDLAYEKYSVKPPVNVLLQHSPYDRQVFLNKFKESREGNQSYLKEFSWIHNEQNLRKLYELVKNGRIKGYTADITDVATWNQAEAALKTMGVEDNIRVIDISNIHGQYWAGGKLGEVLAQKFDPNSDAVSPIVLGAGTISVKRPPLMVFNPSGSASLYSKYVNDPELSHYYKAKSWQGDTPPNSEGLPQAWISRGIWPVVPSTVKQKS